MDKKVHITSCCVFNLLDQVTDDVLLIINAMNVVIEVQMPDTPLVHDLHPRADVLQTPWKWLIDLDDCEFPVYKFEQSSFI